MFRDIGIGAITLIICGVLALGCAVGGIIWTQTVGVAQKNAEREAYKATVTYNEGMIDDLAKYYYEFMRANDDVERSAIAQLVLSRFANFDETRIENRDLRLFLEDCRNGEF